MDSMVFVVLALLEKLGILVGAVIFFFACRASRPLGSMAWREKMRITLEQMAVSLLGLLLLELSTPMVFHKYHVSNSISIGYVAVMVVNAAANYGLFGERRLWRIRITIFLLAFLYEFVYPIGTSYGGGRGSFFNQYFVFIFWGAFLGGFFLIYRAKAYSSIPAIGLREKVYRFFCKTGLTWAGMALLLVIVAVGANAVWGITIIVIAALLTLSYVIEEIFSPNPHVMRWIQRGIPVLLIAGCILLNIHSIRQDKYVINVNEYTEGSRHWFSEKRQDPVALEEEVDLAIQNGYPTLFSSTSLSGLVTSLVDHTFAIPPSEPCEKCGGDHSASIAQSAKWDLTSFPTTPEAYTALIEGRCDIVVAFHPSEEEMARAEAAGVPFRLQPIGREAFVFFVNASNPVDDLPAGRIRDVYAGRVKNWRELGGDNEKMIAYQRRQNSGSQSRMERFMQGDTLMAAPEEHNIFDMGGIVSYVARYHNYANAMGYSFRFFIDHMVDSSGIKMLKVDGAYPSLESIRDGRYPLLDDIYMVTTEKSKPHSQTLIDWMRSPQGQRLVLANSYAPILPVE